MQVGYLFLANYKGSYEFLSSSPLFFEFSCFYPFPQLNDFVLNFFAMENMHFSKDGEAKANKD